MMPDGDCTGGGGLSRIDVADDDDVDVSLFFTVIEKVWSVRHTHEKRDTLRWKSDARNAHPILAGY